MSFCYSYSRLIVARGTMDWGKVDSLLKKHEGLRYTLYKCPAGKLTIGYGHNIEDRGISEKCAEFILQEDREIAYRQVKNAVSDFCILNEARQYVLIDMCFNIGISKLLSFKKMLKALKNNDYSLAAKEMLASKWAAQVPGRAKELSEIMETGEW